MKHMRKVFALALTLIMALALTVPAFAAADDGSITINNTENGKSYDLFKIFDLTYTTVGEGADTKKVAAYTMPALPAWYNTRKAAIIFDLSRFSRRLCGNRKT